MDRSQGHAQAQNLKDSGLKVFVCLKKTSKKIKNAINDGFKILEIQEAVKISDILIILIPDEDRSKRIIL